MFTILGGDQKQYGPVSADEVRQWIRDGRANANTMAFAQGTTEWKPLSAFPEFADLFPSAPGAISPTPGAIPTRTATPEEIAAMDFDLDIFSCIQRGWELVKGNMVIIVVTFLVVAAAGLMDYFINLISGSATDAMIYRQEFSPTGVALVLLSSILNALLQTVFMGGLYMYYLKLIRGQEAGIADAFSGFSHAFVQLALLGLVQGVLVLIGCLFCLVPGIYLAVAWIFAAPLVIDKEMGFWEAMSFSLKVVNKHWFVVLGLILVVGLVSACGIIACCVGVLVTIPVGYVALMYAYEDIFGRQVR